MNKRLTALLLGVFLFTGVVPHVLADEVRLQQLAATDELPPALVTLNPSKAELLTDRQAEAVRGQWILQLNFPLVRTVIQGHGTFQARLLTLSGGVFAGNPVLVQIRIGR